MFKRQITAILTLDASTKDKFRGVCSMDRLPQRKPGAYVINMDDHDEPGSHWVAVYDDNGIVEYMDSYGLPPLDTRCLLFLGSDYHYNSRVLQQQFSNACGFYCVYFLIQRSRGHSANTILDMLARTDSGYVVKNFIYSRYKPIFN